MPARVPAFPGADRCPGRMDLACLDSPEVNYYILLPQPGLPLFHTKNGLRTGQIPSDSVTFAGQDRPVLTPVSLLVTDPGPRAASSGRKRESGVKAGPKTSTEHTSLVTLPRTPVSLLVEL